MAKKNFTGKLNNGCLRAFLETKHMTIGDLRKIALWHDGECYLIELDPVFERIVWSRKVFKGYVIKCIISFQQYAAGNVAVIKIHRDVINKVSEDMRVI